MTEKKKRGRPPGSGKKKLEIRNIDPVTTETAVALYNAEHPEQHTEVIEMKVSEFREKFPQIPEEVLKEMAEAGKKTYPKPDAQVKQEAAENNRRENEKYPSDWDKMTKSEKLAYFTEHRK